MKPYLPRPADAHKTRPAAPKQTSFGTIYIAQIAEDAEYRDELRHRFETDHFFAAEILGFDKFIPELHKPAVDLYFPKNKNLKIEDQHPVKYRLHLDPRHTFKSTLGKVDKAQWIAAFPELITILNESATQPLAEALSLSVAKFFWQKPGNPPTVLQALYPHIVTSVKPDAKWDTACHAIIEMDHTLDYTSPKSTQAGWHPWVLDPDDLCDAINSGIHAEQSVRRTVIDTYYVNKNLLRHGGYINIRGTRYHPFELYGDVLSQIEKNPPAWKVLIRGSLTVISGEPLMPGVFPDEDQVILHFPQLLPYDVLREKFLENYEAFMTQQQNDPRGGSVSVFGDRLYGSVLMAPDRIPPMGDTVTCWRLPYGGKDYMSKHAEGAAARIWNGRVYVLDAWQGIFTPSGLAEKIVRELKHFETPTLMLEAIPGTEYMESHIKNEAIKRNVSLRFQWFEFEEDDNVRQARLRQLEPQMQSGRIFISSALSKSSEIRRQFVHFGLVEENGIVDVISRIAARVPASTMRQEISAEEIELQERRRQDAMFNMAFGQPGVRTLQDDAELARQQLASMRALTVANGLPSFFGLDG
jgi:hypothetical protein